jgi:hypothetical protein
MLPTHQRHRKDISLVRSGFLSAFGSSLPRPMTLRTTLPVQSSRVTHRFFQYSVPALKHGLGFAQSLLSDSMFKCAFPRREYGSSSHWSSARPNVPTSADPRNESSCGVNRRVSQGAIRVDGKCKREWIGAVASFERIMEIRFPHRKTFRKSRTALHPASCAACTATQSNNPAASVRAERAIIPGKKRKRLPSRDYPPRRIPCSE